MLKELWPDLGIRRLVLAIAFVSPIASFAQAPATVKIGKETKKTSGVLKEAVAGDVACYLTLTDERGAEFTEMADFDLCEQPKLIGKRVALRYSMVKVLAEECGGNPDCKKTQTAPVVTKATVRP